MEISDIEFLIDLRSIDSTNEYIQKGWKLVKIYTESYDPEIAPNHLSAHYILGASKDVDYSKELEESKSKLNSIHDSFEFDY